MEDPLVMILRRFGPDTLRDARALDAALRSVPEPVAISDIHALGAAVYSGAIDELVARVSSGQPPLLALDGTADRVARASGMSIDQARGACVALGIAFGVLPDQIAGGLRTGPPPLPPIGDQRQSRRRRFWLIPVTALGVLLVGGLVAVVVVLTQPRLGPVDLEFVAERYGALGAGLLDGTTGCSRIDPAAGETERVRCEFPEFDLILSTYETAATLRTARNVALNTNGSVRSGRVVEDAAAFAMAETADEKSRVYWDITQPQPISATVSADYTDLHRVAQWWDGRRFTALTRPEVTALPKDAFQSDDLQKFAKRFLGASGARCESNTPDDGEQEQVFCSWDNGLATLFHLASDRAAFEQTRRAFLSDRVAVPGSFLREPGGWSDREKPGVKQGEYSQYVSASSNSAIIYFDQDSTACWAFMGDSSGNLQRLREFWENGK